MGDVSGPAAPARANQRVIRAKLLLLVLAPLVVVLVLVIGVLVWGNSAFDRLLITRIQSDLAVANGYFERVLGEVGASAMAAADSRALHDAIGTGQAAAVAQQLRRFKARENLDFINLRTPEGRLIATDHGVAADAPAPPLPPQASPRDGRITGTVAVLDAPSFGQLAPALQALVAVPIVPTRNAAPSTRTREDRAMVVLATAAVRDARGALLGQIQAGVLLNRNLRFIDHINEIVYPDGSLPYGSRGTATLFLDDVRISTNVRLFGADASNRAIGTRVSQAVRDQVLGAGRTWLDRAFVVNEWYVSGYQPITDAAGARVGMLYVGFTERPFTALKIAVMASIGALFLAVMAGAALVLMRWARSIFAPLERMTDTMAQVEGGALEARVGVVDSRDEIGELAQHFDHLLDTIADNTRALQRWNAELDAKVAERTLALEQAQQHLVRSEKLAAVGQLTASIAHEVNNPIAVIQGNLDLVRDLLGADASRVHGELRLVDAQIERMRLIVTRLLQFARPNEFAGYVEAVDVGAALDDGLLLVGHLLAKTRITVERRFTAQRRPAINRHELQQVIVNLLVNATQAMPEGGTLTLVARDADEAETVQIEVADTGPGLGPALIAELFKPFVTRKKDGTGLGLWICKSIVERYGGTISAADRSDGCSGAVFTLTLRC
jgi:two-component system, NtrC family, sensor kinase